MFRRSVLFITSLNKNLSRAFHACIQSEVVRLKLQTLKVTYQLSPLRHLSCIPQRKVEYLTSMQSVPEKTAAGGQCGPHSEPSGTAVRKEPATESKKVKKVKKVKNFKKVRGRKQKEKESTLTQNLLAELPFSSTEIWKELGFTGGESSSEKKRKRAGKGRVEDEEDGEKEKKKKKNCPRPNYFVSIPITNPKIKEVVEELQAEVLQKEPRLSRALIPVGTLHITLLVTHLATQEEIDVAALALEEMQPTLMSLLGGQSLMLPFRGIGHFRQEVAFIQIEEGQHLSTLTDIADSVRKAFEEKGVSSGDQKDFKPHLTFIKLSRAPKLRRQDGLKTTTPPLPNTLPAKGIKKLDPALYAAFEQRVFGEESACTLDLCSMLKKKSADGYYHREKTVRFNLLQTTQRSARTSGKRGPELDDEELVSLSKRLVEDAVFRAVQQYMEETQQNGAAPKDEAPPPLTTNK